MDHFSVTCVALARTTSPSAYFDGQRAFFKLSKMSGEHDKPMIYINLEAIEDNVKKALRSPNKNEIEVEVVVINGPSQQT